MATFPTYNNWDSWTGDCSQSSDGLTLNFTGLGRTQWLDTIDGLDSVSLTGLLSASVSGRSTPSKPDSVSDNAIVLPGSWAYTYDASLNTPFTSQGWALIGSVTSTTNSGGTQTIVNNAGALGYYYKNNCFPTGKNVYIVQIRMNMHSDWNGFYMFDWYSPALTKNACTINLITYGASLGLMYMPNLGGGINRFGINAYWDFLLIQRLTGTVGGNVEVWGRLAGSYSQLDAAGYTLLGVSETATNVSNHVAIAAGWTAAAGTTDYKNVYIGGFNEWEVIANPDTTFTTNERYWQFKTGVSGDYLTTLNVAGSLTAPSGVGGTVPIGLVGTTAVACDASGGGPLYEYQLINSDTSSVSQTIKTKRGAVIFESVANGNWKIGVKSLSTDGVSSTGQVLSPIIAMPAVAAAIALNFDDRTIAPGEVSTLSYSISGSLTATIGGVSISGSGSSGVVTGIDGPPAHVYIDISADHVGPNEIITLDYDVAGNVSATVGGGGITGVGSQDIVTGDPLPVGIIPPDQPTIIDSVSTPNRPSYISYI